MPEKEVIQLITKSKSAVEKEIRKISKELIAIENSVEIKEAGMNYAASGSNPYLQLTDSHGQEVFYTQSYLGNMYIGPTYTKAIGININGEIIQLGAHNNKTVYRKVIDKTIDLPNNIEVEIGDLNGAIDTVLDIKQVATYGGSAYDMYYATDGHHTIIGCRVNLSTGKVYACSCNDSWNQTHLIVYIDYIK